MIISPSQLAYCRVTKRKVGAPFSEWETEDLDVINGDFEWIELAGKDGTLLRSCCISRYDGPEIEFFKGTLPHWRDGDTFYLQLSKFSAIVATPRRSFIRRMENSD